MKTIINIFNYSLVILLLTSVSCSNNDNQEIPTGDHSFYCYIDGELFVPRGNSNITTTPSDDGLSILEYDDFFKITAKDYRKYTVFFNTINREVGVIDLSDSSGSFLDYSLNHAIVRKNGVLYLSKENSGTITFTENSNENVKGTFEFTLYNENDENDTIQVINGHFDD